MEHLGDVITAIKPAMFLGNPACCLDGRTISRYEPNHEGHKSDAIHFSNDDSYIIPRCHEDEGGIAENFAVSGVPSTELLSYLKGKKIIGTIEQCVFKNGEPQITAKPVNGDDLGVVWKLEGGGLLHSLKETRKPGGAAEMLAKGTGWGQEWSPSVYRDEEHLAEMKTERDALYG